MQLGARMRAAVDVLDEIFKRHQPASKALNDWGRSHRFAGSSDRSAIGTIVYDVLRQRLSLAQKMGSDQTRALVLAATAQALKLDGDGLSQAMGTSAHSLEPLSDPELEQLGQSLPEEAPCYIRGDYPQWLESEFECAFGDDRAQEGAALSRRAPIDVRTNTLKAAREKVLHALRSFGARETPLSPIGVRVPVPEDHRRAPNIEAETAHGKGWFEIQDAASQVAALMAGAGPRMQVLDLCAGSGGKTLALAAGMQNTGQIFAYDRDKFQLRPIFERVRRAGVRNLQVLAAGEEEVLRNMQGRFDVVFVDAPCSGSGTWRRRPDAKWRLTKRHLNERLAEQAQVLDLAAGLVKAGGHLVYVTCSVLPVENTDQVESFLERERGFLIRPFAEGWTAHKDGDPPVSADGKKDGLLLTPRRHDTDGFYIARLQKAL